MAFLVLSLIFILPVVIRIRCIENRITMQEPFRKPLEFAAALVLSSQFTWP